MGSKRIPDGVKLRALLAVDLGMMKAKKAAKKGAFHPRNFSTWRNNPAIAARLAKALKAVHEAIGSTPVPPRTPTPPKPTLPLAKAPARKKRVMSEAGREAMRVAQAAAWKKLGKKGQAARQEKMQAGRRKKALEAQQKKGAK